MVVAGTLNEPATVTIQGLPALVTTGSQFRGTVPVQAGASTVSITATDPNGNSATKQFQVSNTGASKTLTYDANGNITADGTRTFEWDAREQLRAVTDGTNRSEFTYDGLRHRVRMVEKENGVVQSDTRLVWCEVAICEERGADGTTVTRRPFTRGEQLSGAPRFFGTDHLSSVTDVTNSSATLLTHYAFDPWGRREVVAGTDVTVEAFSGLKLSRTLLLGEYRAYDVSLGRWLNEDPIGLNGGSNLYAYAAPNPVAFFDSSGLSAAGALQTVSDLTGFITGNHGGGQHGPGDPATQDIADTPVMDQIRQQYLDSGCQSKMYCGDYQYRQLVTTLNLTGQLVGSFCAQITNIGNGNARVNAQNTWGLESGSRLPGRTNRHHASIQQMITGQGKIGYPKSVLEDKTSPGPLQNLIIRWTWTEHLPCGC
jgi:RHS repeat-associated protein